MLRIGCQTYTWEMLGDAWQGSADDLLAAIGGAGYTGIEITDRMIGTYANRPDEFSKALASNGLELIAFAWASPSGFTEADAFGDDLAAAAQVLDFVAQFPNAVLSLGSATVMAPGPYRGQVCGGGEDLQCHRCAGTAHGSCRGVSPEFAPQHAAWDAG